MICVWCSEPIAPDEVLKDHHASVQGPWLSQDLHRECLARQVIGGVRHQQGLCSCCMPGGMATDDPVLSLRDAARAAVAYHRKHSGL